jgi:Na+/proline symporter
MPASSIYILTVLAVSASLVACATGALATLMFRRPWGAALTGTVAGMLTGCVVGLLLGDTISSVHGFLAPASPMRRADIPVHVGTIGLLLGVVLGVVFGIFGAKKASDALGLDMKP